MRIVPARYKAEKGRNLSPGRLIEQSEKDINTKQERISGERFPDNTLELCDNCHWCCTCVDIKGLIGQCPLCGVQVSQIPMTLDEVCVIEFVGKHGATLRFSKKQQLK
jgi:hypothetical protein